MVFSGTVPPPGEEDSPHELSTPQGDGQVRPEEQEAVHEVLVRNVV